MSIAIRKYNILDLADFEGLRNAAYRAAGNNAFFSSCKRGVH